ncbi:MAG: hypothetical protein DWB45_08035 [Xanthomonadales bacterium]|nr:hypothetical protein [Xanthomonadales bacterium]
MGGGKFGGGRCGGGDGKADRGGQRAHAQGRGRDHGLPQGWMEAGNGAAQPTAAGCLAQRQPALAGDIVRV